MEIKYTHVNTFGTHINTSGRTTKEMETRIGQGN